MFSRLHRRAEALNEACLRAQGHPHGHEIQQELLSALEWDDSFHPKHVRTDIPDLSQPVHRHSIGVASAEMGGLGRLRRLLNYLSPGLG